MNQDTGLIPVTVNKGLKNFRASSVGRGPDNIFQQQIRELNNS